MMSRPRRQETAKGSPFDQSLKRGYWIDFRGIGTFKGANCPAAHRRISLDGWFNEPSCDLIPRHAAPPATANIQIYFYSLSRGSSAGFLAHFPPYRADNAAKNALPSLDKTCRFLIIVAVKFLLSLPVDRRALSRQACAKCACKVGWNALASKTTMLLSSPSF